MCDMPLASYLITISFFFFFIYFVYYIWSFINFKYGNVLDSIFDYNQHQQDVESLHRFAKYFIVISSIKPRENFQL